MEYHVFFRDYEKQRKIISDLYDYSEDMTQDKKNGIDSIFFCSVNKLEEMGINDESVFLKNNVSKDVLQKFLSYHKKHIILQIYTYLLRKNNKSTSLQDAFGNRNIYEKEDENNSSKNTITNSFKIWDNNVLSQTFLIEHLKTRRYHVEDSFIEIYEKMCHNPKKGPFVNTILKGVSEFVCDILKQNKTLLDEIFNLYICIEKEKEEVIQIDKFKGVKQISSIQKNAQALTEKFNKNKDLINKINRRLSIMGSEIRVNLYHMYRWCQRLSDIDEIYDFIKCIRKLDEYNISNTDELIELIKKVDITYNTEQRYVEYVSEGDRLSNGIISYLEAQYKLYRDNDITNRVNSKNSYSVKDEILYPKAYFCASQYLTEQMFGYETAKHLAIIVDNNSDKQCNIDQVLPELTYIFAIPNIFIRKTYIDIFFSLYDGTKSSLQLHGFHDNMKDKFSPYLVEDSQLRLFTKEWLLCMSLNYIPMLEQIFYCEFYNYAKNTGPNDDELGIRETMKILLGTYIENNMSDFLILEELKPNKKEKEIIVKVYEAIRKYLYNSYSMKRWSDALDLDYLKHYKKLIVSLVEYERTNIFERPVPSEFFVPLSKFKLKDKYIIK